MDRPAHDLFFGALLGLTIAMLLVGLASLPPTVSTGDWSPVVRAAIAADQRWGSAELSAVLVQRNDRINAITTTQVGLVNLTSGDTITESSQHGNGINTSAETIIRQNGQLWICPGGGFTTLDPIRCSQPFEAGYVPVTSAISTAGIYPATLSFLASRGVAITRVVHVTSGGRTLVRYVGIATDVALNDANAAMILHGGDGHQVLISESVTAPIDQSGHITNYRFHLIEVSQFGQRTTISGSVVLVPRRLSTS